MRAVPPARPLQPRRRAQHRRPLVAFVVVLLAVACAGPADEGRTRDPGAPAPTDDDTANGSRDSTSEATMPPTHRNDRLPAVVPTPRQIRWIGPDAVVPDRATIVAAASVDGATTDLVAGALRAAGASRVRLLDSRHETRDPVPLTVRIGPPDDPGITAALRTATVGIPPELPAEGYVLAVAAPEGGPATVALAGTDPDGAYYAAQTLRQLVVRDRTGRAAIAGVAVTDHPAMRLRGSIEGFYGSPWTHAERLDQLAFHGRFKLNTYVYAPKDDPYHRDRWREPYPVADLSRLGDLVGQAARHHVRFTFAVSPGVSICYSNPSDVAALVAKLQAVHDIGVRGFSLALDDIDYGRWNCDGDAARYGPAAPGAAAQAQVDLLNTVQRQFVDTHRGVAPLQFVPTEYRRTFDSEYRQVIRGQLDGRIEVMWTGPLVVPAGISVAQAQEAAAVFGRKLLVWDNYPVNDYPATEGRLLLGPYTGREPGLDRHVSGIVLNPMNQAAASKVALVGAADFTWNPAAYDPARAHRAAAADLAGGDGTGESSTGRAARATVEALLAFFDLENLAPTSSRDGALAQPQAPALTARIATFDEAWSSGDKAGAIAGLARYAELLAEAPDVIRAGVDDQGFLTDSGPWLDATVRWGRAFVLTLDGLSARIAGDEVTATSRFGEADGLVAAARGIHTIEGETYPQGPVRVADGVLDVFLERAQSLT